MERLVDDLFVDDELRRETAIVRLRLVGQRAMASLSEVIGTAPTRTSVAALRALEGGTSPQIVDLALSALTGQDPAVAEAAVRVLAPWVERERGARLLDVLLGLVMDPTTDARVSAAAREALATLPARLVQPLLAAPAVSDLSASIDPSAIRGWLSGPGRDASASDLALLVERVLARERLATSEDERKRWTSARGSLHAQLARIGSRAALTDLRQTFERTTAPLPLDFLAAVSSIGDAACLDAVARAWSAAPGEPWWQARLSEAATSVMKRLGLTGRHVAVKKLRARYSGFV